MIEPEIDIIEPDIIEPGSSIELSVSEEARERANLAAAKWSILFGGILLTVTNLYDSDGNEIANPMRAVTCVAFDADRTAGQQWLVIEGLDPGEIWSRHNVATPPNHAH